MNTKPCMSSHNKKDNNINLYPILDQGGERGLLRYRGIQKPNKFRGPMAVARFERAMH